MQTVDEKREAIISLLPFIYHHLSKVPGAAKTTHQEWISERSPLDDPPPPPPPPDCNGWCSKCNAKECPPDETWVNECRGLRSKYRIPELEYWLMRIKDLDVTTAQAVWAVYVEPTEGELFDASQPELGCKTEAISRHERYRRAGLAMGGIVWLASKMDGDVIGFGEKVESVDNRIRRMRADFPSRSLRRIAAACHCGVLRVNKVLAEPGA
jgi:hypothetical protein